VRSQKANASYPAGSSRLNNASKSDSPFGTNAGSAHGSGLHKDDSSNSVSSASDSGAAAAAAPASTANGSSRGVVREHAAPERRPTVRMSTEPVLESTAGQQSIV
jgi:hypothetical protein